MSRAIKCIALANIQEASRLETVMLDLGPNLSDDTLLEMVHLPPRIRNALGYAGVKTVGDLREMTERTLRSLPDLGPKSVGWLQQRVRLKS